MADDPWTIRAMAYHTGLEHVCDDDVAAWRYGPAGSENSDVGVGVAPDAYRHLVSVLVPGLLTAD